MLTLFFSALFIFLVTYLSYYLYVKKQIDKPWNLKVDREFEPEITILVPVHNEEKNIEPKLENIKSVNYPLEKIEIIVVDDASEDDTAPKVEAFIERNPNLNIKLIRQRFRAGKSAALNEALKHSTKPIVIVSDADTRWPSDILRKALPYLADPRVGAVTGRGINENSEKSWVTKAEDAYLQLANLLRLGESKIYSTIRFEGGFCAYKRDVFEGFDCETGSDDSGTALEIVQNGYRTILVPNAVFYTSFPTSFMRKLRIKVRRANQLIGLWIKCLKLLLKGRLVLPKRIAIPEIILFVFSPIIFFIMAVTGIGIILFSPFSPLGLSLLLAVLFLLLVARQVFVEIVVDNFVLLSALVTFIFNRRYVAWEK